jgi:hypothetical protein
MNARRHEGDGVVGPGRPVETLRFLVTVKTYPQPSIKHQETVCTAGITAEGRWVRLYPVPFRYWDEKQQYRLYDWVEVKARRRPRNRDTRRESYQPDGDGDLRVTDHTGTEGNWAERKRLILPRCRQSVEELRTRYDESGESLGIIRPAEVTSVKVEREEDDWTPAQRAALTRPRLFGTQPSPLEKVPYRFSYCFRCNDESCRGHTMRITDWGICYLFLKVRREEGEEVAVRKTHARCEQIAGPDHDTCLYLGTVWPHPTFVIIGLFYPKKERPGDQPGLPLG